MKTIDLGSCPHERRRVLVESIFYIKPIKKVVNSLKNMNHEKGESN